MIYITKNGFRVAEQGNVIIEGVKHFVRNGFVACNNRLNHRSWNTTEENSTCKDCLQVQRNLTNQKQLNLF